MSCPHSPTTCILLKFQTDTFTPVYFMEILATESKELREDLGRDNLMILNTNHYEIDFIFTGRSYSFPVHNSAVGTQLDV